MSLVCSDVWPLTCVGGAVSDDGGFLVTAVSGRLPAVSSDVVSAKIGWGGALSITVGGRVWGHTNGGWLVFLINPA